MVNQTNKKLFVIAFLSLFLALITQFVGSRRPEIERGQQPFLLHFLPEDISKIEITQERGKKLILQKKEDAFYMVSEKGYKAENEKMNTFFSQIEKIRIHQQVHVDKKDYSELQINEGNIFRKIVMWDKNEKEIYNFYIGKSYKSQGQYLRNNGEEKVYLSEERTFPLYRRNQFLNHKIYDKKEHSVDKLFFQDYYLKNEKSFDIQTALQKELLFSDGEILRIYYQEEKEAIYFKVALYSKELPKKLMLKKDFSQEELEKANIMLNLREKLIKFNQKHAPYVYKVEKGKFPFK